MGSFNIVLTMRLRNGKRSLKEVLTLYEKKHPNKKPVKTNQIDCVIAYGEYLTKLALDKDEEAKQSLNDSDKFTRKLYTLNRTINETFIKIIEEKTNRRPSKKKIKELENTLKEQKVEHRYLLQQSKILLLEAKRHFAQTKRIYKDGNLKYELGEKTIRYRRKTQIFVGEECSICMGDIESDERTLIVKECKHFYHHACFMKWCEYHSTCPTCRDILEPEVVAYELPVDIANMVSWADITETNISSY